MQRRKFLEKSMITATMSMALPSFAISISRAKQEIIIGHNDFRYRVHKEWAKLSPGHTPLLNCHEMVQDGTGRLIMVGDHPRNNILIFDRSGKLLDSWGTQFPGGHGIAISEDGGEDNLFIADCGWYQAKDGSWQKQAGKVAKMTNDGRLIFTLGHPKTIGIYEVDAPFMPTEIAVAPNGDFYVADGYGSDYIIQYSADGEYIRHFGGRNNEDARLNIVNAHGVAIDQRDPQNPQLVVTSRNEHSFKYFTLAGEYVNTVHLPGAFVCRPVFNRDQLYAGVCWSTTREGKGWVRDTGFVTILDAQNLVVSNPGGEPPTYVDGKLQAMLQASGEEKVFNHGHDVCVDQDENLYVCQWNAYQTPPIFLERV